MTYRAKKKYIEKLRYKKWKYIKAIRKLYYRYIREVKKITSLKAKEINFMNDIVYDNLYNRRYNTFNPLNLDSYYLASSTKRYLYITSYTLACMIMMNLVKDYYDTSEILKGDFNYGELLRTIIQNYLKSI